MDRKKTVSRYALSAALLVALAAAAGMALYFGCGGGAQTIRITALDAGGNPLAGIHAAILGGTSASALGVTGSDGRATLSDPSLSGPVDISLGSTQYRNYTIAQVESRDLQVALNELARPMGYSRITIEESTWGALVDDIANNIYRFAFVLVLFDDVTDIMDMTGCEDAMEGGGAIMPGDPAMASLLMPLHAGASRLFAVAGLFDRTNNIITFFKAGSAEVNIGTEDACGEPEAVSIPLGQDVHQDSSVTLNVTAPMPQGTESPFQLLTVSMEGGTLGFMGGMLNVAIGAERVADNSYLFKAFKLSEIGAQSPFYGQGYVTLSGFSNDEGDGRIIWSFNLEGLAFSDQAQAQPPTGVLLATPAELSPAHNSATALGESLALSWGEVDDADFYFVTLGTQFVNGTVIDDKAVWQGMAPAGVTSFEIPVAASDMFGGVESCQVYRLSIRAFEKDGFDYEGGIYPQLYDLMIEDLPTLISSNSSTFFTSGNDCGPLISIIWPFGGGAGNEVTITGMYFGSAQGTSTVTFDGTPAAVTSWSDSSIVVTSPAGTAGSISTVLVNAEGKVSNSGFYQY